MKNLKIATALTAITIWLPACGPVGKSFSSNSARQLEDSSILDLQSNRVPPPRPPGPVTGPAPAPTPAPVPAPPPPPPPVPLADYVCTNAGGSGPVTFCNSTNVNVNLDQMEKYVRTINRSLDKAETVCLPAHTSHWRGSATHPVSWACASALFSHYFDIDFRSYTNDPVGPKFLYRREQAVRPAAGYRSYNHFNAPFRCLGGSIFSSNYAQGEDVFYVYTRANLVCYFSNNLVSAEALTDAIAEANELVTHDTHRFNINCEAKPRLIGATNQKNIPINVLECTYK